MKKEDLKVNDIVKTRDRTSFIIHSIGEDFVLVNRNDFFTFKDYNPDLTHWLTPDLDIIEVRRPKEIWGLIPEYWHENPILWRSDKPRRMTRTELFEELGYEVEIIDED